MNIYFIHSQKNKHNFIWFILQKINIYFIVSKKKIYINILFILKKLNSQKNKHIFYSF